MSALLEVRDIAKRFPRSKRPALDGVGFDVHDQELLTLVGASGSGKTSLLRILAGLELPDRGEVRLEGEVLTRGPRLLSAPEHRGMGFVFQNHALFPHLKVRENVAFGLKRRERSAERVSDLLQRAGLELLADRYPHELSGGERQRIALLRALAPGPRLLLMDEPFSSLDQSLREQMRDETRRLIKQHGATTILVTHDTVDALAVSDRIVVLREGVIQQVGRPDEIYRRPANRYIASSFGPCNFLKRSDLPLDPGIAGLQGIEPEDRAEAEIWIRPEDLMLSGAGTPEQLAEGFVVQNLFHGDSRIVTIECPSPGGAAFTVQVRKHGSFQTDVGDRLAVVTAPTFPQ